MTGINGRRKGKTGEREVSRIIEAWWQPFEKDCKFKSTPLSGGWSSPDVRGHFKTAGDLVTTARKFPFTIEVKRREGWNLNNLINGKWSPVWGWWLQCQRAADEETREPMMWFRKSREPVWRVMVRLDFHTALVTALPDGMGGYTWTSNPRPMPEHGAMPVLMFADKLLAVPPRVIVKVGATLKR